MKFEKLGTITPLIFALYAMGTSVYVLSEEVKEANPTVSGEQNRVEQDSQGQASAENQEIEAQIKRIEKKLESEPKVEGWVLVGDAYMHLRYYSDAVNAYQKAYLLSNGAKEVKSKLKDALYYAGLKG